MRPSSTGPPRRLASAHSGASSSNESTRLHFVRASSRSAPSIERSSSGSTPRTRSIRRCPRTRSRAPLAVSHVTRSPACLRASPGRIEVVRTTSPSAPVLMTSSSTRGTYRRDAEQRRTDRASAASDGRDELEDVAGGDGIAGGEPVAGAPHGRHGLAVAEEVRARGRLLGGRVAQDLADGGREGELELAAFAQRAGELAAGAERDATEEPRRRRAGLERGAPREPGVLVE